MQKLRTGLVLGMLVATAACGTQADPSATGSTQALASEEVKAATGIVSYEIARNEQGVSIQGLGADGAKLAEVTVTLSQVGSMATDDYAVVSGELRSLRVQAAQGRFAHDSDAELPVTLPPPTEKTVAVLLADAPVTAELAKFLIAFETEVPYALCPNTPGSWSCSGYNVAATCYGNAYHSGVTACCQNGVPTNTSGVWQNIEAMHCTSDNPLSIATCGTGHASDQAGTRRCRTPNVSGQTTTCGSTGAAGCAVCGTFYATCH